MTLAHGRPYLAIPGPSVMPDRVLQAMHRPAPNIYEGALEEMVDGMIPDLKGVARTGGRVAIYVANGHGAWEAALANIALEGARVLMPATGRFGHGWAGVARGLGIGVEMIDFGRAAPIDPARVEAALRADLAAGGAPITAVMASHVDTSTSILNDIKALRAAMDRAGHPALLMVDCIASLGCDRFEMDEWGVDVMVAASQKGLMVPPGLSFVFYSEKAEAVRAKVPRVSLYWDWTPRGQPDAFYQYFGGTAPTHHLYGLRESLDMLAEEGLENVWARHRTLARSIWAAAEVWGQGGPLTLNVADPALRSSAVTALGLGGRNGLRLRKWCERHAGVTLGIGLGMDTPEDPKSEGFFRIGHMGHLNPHMILGLLGSLQAGFTALDIPFGSGGLDAAISVISNASQEENVAPAQDAGCCI
ncbi:aminotransferase [Litorivita pollutaquae]|uniref:Aminotransferase n=1 Tax=Litorivita pollutaquae TaxID=2200892 RepID=A0A2V4ND45_9RHOB|nr:aminotransferase class V-fold PLP-dependent enzyme [Litorivita pollutaquae]PYC48163.1 aminotransferase [Litorivita pollutaquae]